MATPPEATEALRHIEQTRRRTRADLQGGWFPLILFGALTLLSAPVVAVYGGPALGVYWLIAAPAGMLLTARHYRSRERQIGLVSPTAAAHWVTAAGILVGALGTGIIGGTTGHELVAAVGPMLAVAAGYAVFAYLERRASLGGLATALGLVAAGVWVASPSPDTAALLLALAVGGALLATGLVYRSTETRP